MSTEPLKPYQDKAESKGEQVEEMFDNISGNYDFLNKMISLGMDKKWKRKVLKILQKRNPKNILDIATGTGDMAILFAETKAENILGVDISTKMLEVADVKIKSLNLQDRVKTDVQNSERLTLEDKSFEAVTVSYGIRNFEDLKLGLSEILRVLQDDGTLVILETSVPKNPVIRGGYMFYTKHIMPRLAKLFSKDKSAYDYLSSSAINFPHGAEMKSILEEVGFKNVEVKPQFLGVTSIYYAEK
ncbi:MAG TPA: bifunctional demethylmenaquinone methyltransferase/2-methoxy-6-polyprenyl-1,4-benzoquinol methylase UbiE [Brumimicrobium sp.]|nr:bifunctional demethylmenaquinone methyltransferase/2-methoxy-6-polyprenyl-1,4-benzoquinol methylase UbiE [Brumimicrobium sp.]